MKQIGASPSQKALFILILLMVAGPSYAQDHYIIGTEDIDYLPYIGNSEGHNAEKNKLTGYAVDIFDDFFKSEKASFAYNKLPIKRLFKQFLFEDSLDFKYPDSASWKPELREGKEIFYSIAINKSINGLIIHLDNRPANAESIKTIGAIRGVVPWSYINAIKTGEIKLKEYAKTSYLINSLLAKRIDAAYIDTAVAKLYLKDFPAAQKSKIRFDTSFPHDVNLYQMSSMKHPEMISRLNLFLKNNPKIIEDLSVKYGVSSTPLKSTLIPMR